MNGIRKVQEDIVLEKLFPAREGVTLTVRSLPKSTKLRLALADYILLRDEYPEMRSIINLRNSADSVCVLADADMTWCELFTPLLETIEVWNHKLTMNDELPLEFIIEKAPWLMLASGSPLAGINSRVEKMVRFFSEALGVTIKEPFLSNDFFEWKSVFWNYGDAIAVKKLWEEVFWPLVFKNGPPHVVTRLSDNNEYVSLEKITHKVITQQHLTQWRLEDVVGALIGPKKAKVWSL